MVNARSATWKWSVCALLLCASSINYMDRQTLANAAVRITNEFALSQEQYGNLELAFGWAFAAGSLVFGLLADRISIRWLYPIALFGWSVAGFATGLSGSCAGLCWDSSRQATGLARSRQPRRFSRPRTGAWRMESSRAAPALARSSHP